MKKCTNNNGYSENVNKQLKIQNKRTSKLSDSAGLISAFNSRDLIFMWYNVLIYVYNIYELEAAEATFLRPYLFHIFSSYSN